MARIPRAAREDGAHASAPHDVSSSSAAAGQGQDIGSAGRQRWLLLARVGVLALAALLAAFFAAGIGPYFAYIVVPCSAGGQCLGEQASEVAAAQAAAAGITLPLYAGFLIALQAIYMLVTLGVALVLVWRRPRDGFALFTAFTLLVWTSFVVDVLSAGATANAAWGVLSAVISLAGFPAFTLFFFLFPTGHFISRRSRWFAGGLVAVTLVFFIVGAVRQGGLPLLAYLVLFVLWFISLLSIQIYRYQRISTPIQRQQTKWVVYGLVVALAGFVALLSVQAFTGGTGALNLLLNGLYYPFELLVPLSIGVAILRSRLYDIDAIIHRTLVYGLLTAILAATYAAGVIGTQSLIGGIFGRSATGQPIGIVATTLLVAALFQPLRRTLQNGIDRRFYRRRYDAARTLREFAAMLRGEIDLDELTLELVARVDETMRPARISLWLQDAHAARDGHTDVAAH